MTHVMDTYMNYLVPMVVEQTNRGDRTYDIYSRLLKERSSSSRARSTTRSRAWWWRSCSFLRLTTRRKRSTCTSTRRGGVVTSGLAVYDTMQFVRPPISTHARCRCAYMNCNLAFFIKGEPPCPRTCCSEFH
jgi:ATP-dependent Clp protease, protease subunit